MLGYVPYLWLQTQPALRLETKVAGLILAPNLILLVPAVKFYGVTGAAAVAVIRSAGFLVLRMRAKHDEFPRVDSFAFACDYARVYGHPLQCQRRQF